MAWFRQLGFRRIDEPRPIPLFIWNCLASFHLSVPKRGQCNADRDSYQGPGQKFSQRGPWLRNHFDQTSADAQYLNDKAAAQAAKQAASTTNRIFTAYL